MAGMNLMSALSGYEQGMAERRNVEQMKAEQRMQAVRAQADAAYGAVHQQSQDEWARSGAPGQYKPSDETEFAAAEARGNALAQAGDWKGYLQNEGLVASQRIRARSQAVQQFEADGDPEALVRKVYPTIFNGKKVVGTKKVPGDPGAAAVGNLPAVPPSSDSVEITYNDGTTETKPVAQLVAGLKRSLIDPAKDAELEVKNNFLIERERAKGEEARATEGVKADGRDRVANTRGKYALELGDKKLGGVRETNASREKIAAGRDSTSLAVANTRAGATTEAATIGAESRRDVAEASAGASNYRADKGLAGATVRANAPAKAKPADEAKSFDALHNEIRKIAGDPSQGVMGGTKTQSESTLKIARAADAAIKAGVPRATAMQEAIQAWNKAQAAKKPKE